MQLDVVGSVGHVFRLCQRTNRLKDIYKSVVSRLFWTIVTFFDPSTLLGGSYISPISLSCLSLGVSRCCKARNLKDRLDETSCFEFMS